MKNILLHICCAVDLVYTIEILKKEYDNIILYFYDPNIHPYSEYLIRLHEVQRLARINKLSLIVGQYDEVEWIKSTIPLSEYKEGDKRCIYCHGNVLNSSFKIAKSLNIDTITTTLYMSPLKDFTKLDNIGLKLSNKYNIKFITTKFRKNNGITNTQRITKEYEIYKQNYCGCIYALNSMKNNPFKELLYNHTTRGIWPLSNEALEELLSLRITIESYGIPTKLIKTPTICSKIKRAILKYNNSYVKNFYIAPNSKSIFGNINFKVTKIDSYNNYKEIILNKDIIRVIYSKKYIKIKDDLDTTPIIYINFLPNIGDSFKLFLETKFYFDYPQYSLLIGNSKIINEEFNTTNILFYNKYNRIETLKKILENHSNTYLINTNWKFI